MIYDILSQRYAYDVLPDSQKLLVSFNPYDAKVVSRPLYNV